MPALPTDPHYRDKQGNSSLMIAIARGDDAIVDAEIAADRNIDSCNKDGETPLMRACALKRADYVEKLLQHHAATDIVDDRNKNTALMIAIRSGDAECFRLLRAANAGTTIVNAEGRVALAEAALCRRNAFVEDLLKDTVHPDHVARAMHIAIDSDNEDLLRLLLSSGIHPDSDEVHSPLCHAASRGAIKCLKLLLEAGADPDRTNEYQRTPLMCAIDGQYSRCVHELLTHPTNKADPNITIARHSHLQSALSTAVYSNDRFSARHLLDAGAKIDEGILFLAIKKAETRLMEMLIDAGADPNMPNKDGDTVLLKALEWTRRPDTIEMLLNKGADPNQPDAEGTLPLIAAILLKHDRPDYVRPLLAARADPNARDASGRSLLEIAKAEQSDDCVALLTEAGAQKTKVRHGAAAQPKKAAAPAGEQPPQQRPIDPEEQRRIEELKILGQQIDALALEPRNESWRIHVARFLSNIARGKSGSVTDIRSRLAHPDVAVVAASSFSERQIDNVLAAADRLEARLQTSEDALFAETIGDRNRLLLAVTTPNHPQRERVLDYLAEQVERHGRRALPTAQTTERTDTEHVVPRLIHERQ